MKKLEPFLELPFREQRWFSRDVSEPLGQLHKFHAHLEQATCFLKFVPQLGIFL